MFNLKSWLNRATNPQEYIWLEVVLIQETSKAILIIFDDKKIWLPKAWIKAIKRHPTGISIKISLWHWAKKG